MKLPGGYHNEVTTIQVVFQWLEEEISQAVARPLEKGSCRIEAGLRASAEHEATKGELQHGTLSRHLRRAAETPQAEPSPGTGHSMESTVVLYVLHKGSLADCLSQLSRIGKIWSLGEVSLRRAAALSDRSLDSSLLADERPDVIAFE